MMAIMMPVVSMCLLGMRGDCRMVVYFDETQCKNCLLFCDPDNVDPVHKICCRNFSDQRDDVNAICEEEDFRKDALYSLYTSGRLE